jgi:transposase
MAVRGAGRGRPQVPHGHRDRAIDVLKAAFVKGRLDIDEFDVRVGQALAARRYAELATITADLPGALPETQPPRKPPRWLINNAVRWAASGIITPALLAAASAVAYGAGLTAAVRRRDLGVVEVLRTDRRDRRLRGKSDSLDAENAARAVLSGNATATPKTSDGIVEMLRQIKAAKDVAVKARTAAMVNLKQVLVNAPPDLREQLQPLPKMALIGRCAGLRPGPVNSVAAATKHTLRSIARRWQQLNDEIKTHEKLLGELTGALVPQLVAAFGVGPDTAAELLIVAGDNIGRVRSEARHGTCIWRDASSCWTRSDDVCDYHNIDTPGERVINVA